MIVRRPVARGFAKIPNVTLNDHSISYAALGVLCHLLGHHDGWRVTHEGLMRSAGRPGREGKRAVLGALRELRRAGYSRQRKVRGERGRFVTETWVSNVALSVAEWDAEFAARTGPPGVSPPTSGGPDVGGPDVGGPDVGSLAPLLKTGGRKTGERKTGGRETRPSSEEEARAPAPTPRPPASVMGRCVEPGASQVDPDPLGDLEDFDALTRELGIS